MTVDSRFRWLTAGLLPALLISGGLGLPRLAVAQTAFGEIEGRPAPVSRRQCVGGGNAGSLCNQPGDCPGGACQPTNFFNPTVAVRFNATAAQLTTIQNAFSQGSQILFDATDGQAQFGQVTIFNNSTGTNGHFWINNAGGCSTDTGSWGSYSGGNTDLAMGAVAGANGAACVAHEFIHLAYDARDEYEARAAGCGAVTGAAQCPDSTQGANSAAAAACLMECCARIGNNELCWGQAAGDNLAAGDHDATNVTEQSRCRSNRSCWDQVGWSWPNTHLVPAGAPNPGSNGLVHTPVVFQQPAANARLVMVLDRSGSMSLDTPTRLSQLQTAAIDVVDIAENGIELGIVSFSTTASDDKAVAALGANRTTWRTPVNNLTASGATNIGDGLQHAWDMIVAAGGVTANTGVILMTDGLNNRPIGNAAADLQAKIDNLLANGVPVFVTCTGDDLGIDSQCAEIAAGTGGTYVDSADAAELPQRFVSFYEQIAGRALAKSIRAGANGPREPLAYRVEPGAGAVTFAVQWTDPNGEAKVTAIDPTGRTFETRSIPQGSFLRVEKPEPGIWHLRVDFHGGGQPGEWVASSWIANPRIGAPGALRHKVIQPGEAFEICSRPLLETALLGLDISGEVVSPSGKRTPITLRDDGGLQSSSGDEEANDGRYCAKFSDTKERGAYVFELRVVAQETQAVVDSPPGVEFITPEMVPFERTIQLSGTVDDREADQDHFKCYKARPSRRYGVERRKVELEDQFGRSSAVVGQPINLCTPVDKNGEGIRDEGAHLECYALKDEASSRSRYVEVTNQFGTERLKVGAAKSLCLPTIKNGERSRLEVEHFKCYEAFPEKESDPRKLTLRDQFVKTRSVAYGARTLCNPVSKSGEEVRDKQTHLTCYPIKDRTPGEYPGRVVKTENQFGRGAVSIYRPEELCLPSDKTEIKR